MDGLVLTEALIILLMVTANAFFSGAEIAIISANRGRLREWAESGDLKAGLALRLAENPNRFLPTVQVGITLVGTFAAAFGGATLERDLERWLAASPYPFVARHSPEGALGLVVTGITLVTVVVGELVPKRLALSNPAAVARWVARPIDLLARVARPVVWCLGLATDAVSYLFGVRHVSAPGISMQEIRHLIELGTAEGVVDPVEQRLAFEALQLGDRTVRQIMKPRIDIDALDVQTPQEVVLGAISMAGFSRLPVYEGDLDHIIGFVHLKDVLRQHYLGWKLELRKLVRPALIVPQTMRLDQLLVRFQEQRNQLAIIVDEFGSTRGMVTLEDVLEELVGELLTEHHDRVEQLIVQRDPASWLVDGSVSIVDLLEHLNRSRLLRHAPKNVTTVAGLVLVELGRIPAVGEHVDWHDLHLEVVDLDGQRIDRILISVDPPPTPA
ncbi:MAG: hemolysin family protein [Planctomycetales bacterium]